MSSDIFIGALLSIPIGIGTGLAVPAVQRWLENRGKARSFNQDKRTAEDYKNVLYSLRNPQLTTQYFIQVALQTAMVGAIIGTIGGLITVANLLILAPTRLSRVGIADARMAEATQTLTQVLAILITTFGSVLIISLCNPAMRLWSR
jgi:hypothetical protein